MNLGNGFCVSITEKINMKYWPFVKTFQGWARWRLSVDYTCRRTCLRACRRWSGWPTWSLTAPATHRWVDPRGHAHHIFIIFRQSDLGGGAGLLLLMKVMCSVARSYFTSMQLTVLYRKSNLCITRNETVQPRSQFLHLCVCERFIYSKDRSA